MSFNYSGEGNTQRDGGEAKWEKCKSLNDSMEQIHLPTWDVYLILFSKKEIKLYLLEVTKSLSNNKSVDLSH